MPKVTIIKDYRYSPDGLEVIKLEPGEHELTERWAAKAAAAGFTKKEKPAPKNKEKKSAPVNKAR